MRGAATPLLPVRAAAVLLLPALLAALPPREAAAQGPDAASPTRPPAPPYAAPRVAFSVTLGTLGVGDLQAQPVLAEVVDEAGVPTAADTLARTLGAEDGFQVGGSALVGLTPAWAVRAGLTLGRATLVAGYAGEEAYERGARGLAGPASTDLSVLAAEGALRFRLPSGRRVQPYAELGVALVRVEAADTSFPGAGSLTGEASPSVLGALGAIIPIRGALTGRVQASAHYLRTPAGLAPADAPVAAGDTLRLTFAAARAAPFADATREVLRVLRLDIGLSLEVGRVARPRAAPAAGTSAPRP
ncbi:MAG TPA: hypothetical protein VMM12_11030 [Longimicrobiales bacterium]|nr:hypothetical protein [Longimicrobiales bacterium]